MGGFRAFLRSEKVDGGEWGGEEWVRVLSVQVCAIGCKVGLFSSEVSSVSGGVSSVVPVSSCGMSLCAFVRVCVVCVGGLAFSKDTPLLWSVCRRRAEEREEMGDGRTEMEVEGRKERRREKD